MRLYPTQKWQTGEKADTFKDSKKDEEIQRYCFDTMLTIEN